MEELGVGEVGEIVLFKMIQAEEIFLEENIVEKKNRKYFWLRNNFCIYIFVLFYIILYCTEDSVDETLCLL